LNYKDILGMLNDIKKHILILACCILFLKKLILFDIGGRFEFLKSKKGTNIFDVRVLYIFFMDD